MNLANQIYSVKIAEAWDIQSRLDATLEKFKSELKTIKGNETLRDLGAEIGNLSYELKIAITEAGKEIEKSALHQTAKFGEEEDQGNSHTK